MTYHTKPRLFVVGPMEMYRNRNHDAFLKASEKLSRGGYNVLTPNEVCKPTMSPNVALRSVIGMIMLKAQGVATLDGQSTSKEMLVPMATALDCGIPVRTVKEWLDRAPIREVDKCL